MKRTEYFNEIFVTSRKLDTTARLSNQASDYTVTGVKSIEEELKIVISMKLIYRFSKNRYDNWTI